LATTGCQAQHSFSCACDISSTLGVYPSSVPYDARAVSTDAHLMSEDPSLEKEASQQENWGGPGQQYINIIAKENQVDFSHPGNCVQNAQHVCAVSLSPRCECGKTECKTIGSNQIASNSHHQKPQSNQIVNWQELMLWQ